MNSLCLNPHNGYLCEKPLAHGGDHAAMLTQDIPKYWANASEEAPAAPAAPAAKYRAMEMEVKQLASGKRILYIGTRAYDGAPMQPSRAIDITDLSDAWYGSAEKGEDSTLFLWMHGEEEPMPVPLIALTGGYSTEAAARKDCVDNVRDIISHLFG